MELIQYVRVNRGPRKGNLRGVVVANENGIGWSYCRTSKQTKDGKVIPPDRFDKVKGLMIARARTNIQTAARVPRDVQPVLRKMEVRRERMPFERNVIRPIRD